MKLTVAEELLLNQLETVVRNKKAQCNSISCDECICGSERGMYVEDIYDSDEDECITICTALDEISNTIRKLHEMSD